MTGNFKSTALSLLFHFHFWLCKPAEERILNKAGKVDPAHESVKTAGAGTKFKKAF